MLVIRAEQMQVLAASRRARLATRILDFLKTRHPSSVAGAGSGGLEPRIVEWLEIASAHGFHAPWDLCRYCELEWLHGPRFDARCRWASRILGRAEYSPTEKMDRLESFHLNYLESSGPRA